MQSNNSTLSTKTDNENEHLQFTMASIMLNTLKQIFKNLLRAKPALSNHRTITKDFCSKYQLIYKHKIQHYYQTYYVIDFGCLCIYLQYRTTTTTSKQKGKISNFG